MSVFGGKKAPAELEFRMAEIRPYYSDKGLSAVHYDLTTALDPALAGDIDIYAGLAPPGGRMLELGAGTGRVAFALAERGLSVVGVDLAPAMLAQAQARLAKAPPEIAARLSFVRGDMTALPPGEPVDAVICPYYGLAHLPAGAAWKNVFKGAARRLQAGGMAAFHLPFGERMAEAPPVQPGVPVFQAPVEAGRMLSIYIVERAAKPAIGRYDQVLDYVVTDARGREEHRARERQTFYAADPTPFAEAAGLAVDRDPIVMGGVGAIHVFRRG